MCFLLLNIVIFIICIKYIMNTTPKPSDNKDRDQKKQEHKEKYRKKKVEKKGFKKLHFPTKDEKKKA